MENANSGPEDGTWQVIRGTVPFYEYIMEEADDGVLYSRGTLSLILCAIIAFSPS